MGDNAPTRLHTLEGGGHFLKWGTDAEQSALASQVSLFFSFLFPLHTEAMTVWLTFTGIPLSVNHHMLSKPTSIVSIGFPSHRLSSPTHSYLLANASRCRRRLPMPSVSLLSHVGQWGRDPECTHTTRTS